MIAWSYGGGWQSVAIGVLIVRGVLPKPDLACIADTSRERGTTWEYMRDHMQPFLDPIGLNIEVAPHSFARVDLFNEDGLTIVPAYTAEGRLGAYCSGEWKRDAMERWLRSKGVKECVQWIGYSYDETKRYTTKSGELKGPHRPWCIPGYPLVDLKITRKMIPAIIASAGLPIPHKSRCWCCPHQTADEWEEVRGNPEEWAAAVALEKRINEMDPEQTGRLYLSSGRIPLEQADFSRPLFDIPTRCDTAGCWT